jgi:hypothetical protein
LHRDSHSDTCARPAAKSSRALFVAFIKLTTLSAYPHLRAHLEGENVESFKELERGQDWDSALQSISGWLV